MYMYIYGEGNGTPLQYSCLEDPMAGGAWQAAVHGVAKSQTRLSNFTFTFYFHALEKKMATHSSFLPGESQGLGSLVGCHLWGHTESDTTEVTQQQQQQHVCMYIYIYIYAHTHSFLISFCIMAYHRIFFKVYSFFFLFFKTFVYFYLEDNSLTMLSWFLPYINMNQPQVYICPLLSLLHDPFNPLGCHREPG